jgi:chromosome segregation ATPase
LESQKLNLETTLTSCQTELTLVQRARDTAESKITSLESEADAARKRIQTLESDNNDLDKEVSRISKSIHVVLADPVTDLLTRLQRLMDENTHGVDPLVDQVSAVLVGAFPDDSKNDFIRRVVIRLEERIHPAARANVHEMLSELEEKIEDHEEV